MNVTFPVADGHSLPAIMARPQGTPRGAVVVLHEAFGVTPHIRQMCDWLAGEGYVAVAPEMFSRVEAEPAKRVLPYNRHGLEQGRTYIKAMPREKWLEDMAAAVNSLQEEGLPVALVGYCWGGSLAYMGACKIEGVACAVTYYGGMMKELAEAMQPAVPVQIHMAAHDRYIPLEPAKAMLEKNVPQAELYVYDADHGFNRNGGVTYNEACAHTARNRTLAFLGEKLGQAHIACQRVHNRVTN